MKGFYRESSVTAHSLGSDAIEAERKKTRQWGTWLLSSAPSGSKSDRDVEKYLR